MNRREKIGELILLLGIGLFVGGAIGYLTGQLPTEQIPGIGALALMFTVIGLNMKKAKQ